MATYRYNGKDGAGRVQQGTIVADSEAAALRLLTERKVFVTELALESTLSTSAGGLTMNRRVKLAELSGFYSQLADLLAGGVPMLRAIDVLSRQKSGRMGPIVTELREDVAAGAALADAMEKHTVVFPELHVGMVRAGEQGGFLEAVLARLAKFVEQRDQLRQRVVGAMFYPMFLLLAGVTIVLVLVTYFMPKLMPLFAGKPIPPLTQAVMNVATVIRSYGWLIGLVVTLLVILLLPYVRSIEGQRWMDRVKIKIPVVGSILLMVAICRFCRVLGTLLANGVPMLAALTISRDSAGNHVLSETIAEAGESVRAGKSLASTLGASGLFPMAIVDIIAVAEETNRLDVVLIELSDRQEERISRQVDNAVRLLEPAMLLVVFAMVFVIAMALLLPILQAGSTGM